MTYPWLTLPLPFPWTSQFVRSFNVNLLQPLRTGPGPRPAKEGPAFATESTSLGVEVTAETTPMVAYSIVKRDRAPIRCAVWLSREGGADCRYVDSMETQALAVNVISFLFSRNVFKYIYQVITCYNWMLDIFGSWVKWWWKEKTLDYVLNAFILLLNDLTET